MGAVLPDLSSLQLARLSEAEQAELIARLEWAAKDRAERSLAEFTRQAWPVIEPGTPLTWNWHLDVICAYLEAFFDGRIRRLILNVPPGSMKSVLVSVMGPAWQWIHRPAARMLNLTNEIGLAGRDSRRMKDIVTSDWYQRNWGDRVQLSGDQREKLHFENTAKGFRQGLGLTSNITGKRGNYLLIDDPVDAKKAFSDTIIQTANDTYDQAVSSRLNDPANDGICLIMQRLRTNDLTGHLQAKKSTRWVTVRIPMEYEGEPGYDPVRDLGPEYAHLIDPRRERGELFFPARFTADVVAQMREDLGDYGWAGQAQQRPVPLGGGILKARWWRVWGQFGWTRGRALPTVKHVFASWDTAFSERDKKNSAYSAMTLWGVFFDEQAQRDALILLSSWHDRVEYADLKAKVAQVSAEKLQRESDAHLIEKKASGISLIQDLRRNARVRIRSFTPKPGEDKVQRAYLCQPLLQQGQVYVPDKPWAEELVNLVSEFPMGGGACADLTDTVTQAIRYLHNGWWLSHPDDEDERAPGESAAEHDEDDDDVTQYARVGYG